MKMLGIPYHADLQQVENSTDDLVLFQRAKNGDGHASRILFGKYIKRYLTKYLFDDDYRDQVDYGALRHMVIAVLEDNLVTLKSLDEWKALYVRCARETYLHLLTEEELKLDVTKKMVIETMMK